ncbi:MAG TPA: hypothetical protein QF604_15085 [Candidatus Latescibacteria bacterium]|jgi:hypothetical protein|nr:hypothetical protein [Candidatus Latescibacterota bacterium]MEE3041584.1 hypothetical protein [Candidatus Latescibacterota bacterium]HJN29234.1 hypothetical protein [Candidatus Latescibacterota bacterium]|tara:strand:- start:1101 stop:1250 length:150 start_codon:yes stop_codon:yes gene_type:complete
MKRVHHLIEHELTFGVFILVLDRRDGLYHGLSPGDSRHELNLDQVRHGF